ncbi:MAG: gluconate 2-dehydrogenase subunit 3 family protein [Bryobacteraceae bacterium]
MSTYSSDRRSLLKIFGSIGATCAYPFASDELYAQTTATPAPETARHFFNKSDFAVISRLADLIVPETDSPGAVRAGVPDYIDMVIARNAGQQAVVADGLHWLASKNFMQLDEAAQYAVLEPLCQTADSGDLRARNVEFFALIKSLTADGYYTSRTGLIDELHYHGNTPHAGYPTCPEH